MSSRWLNVLSLGVFVLITSPSEGHDSVIDPLEEVECLALNVYWESRGQLLEGQFAVALVTMTRVASSTFPKTICEVVWQKSWSRKYQRSIPQFSWTLDGKSDRPLEEAAWIKAGWVALLVYRGMVPDFTNGATHYHNKKISPWWEPSFAYITKIGDHLFYK